VHRSRNKKENSFLYNETLKMIDERNGVRRTKGWNGVGKMVGVGEHLDRKGDHCDFVIKPKLRKKWSNEAEKTILNKCGCIFKKYFGKKTVGFKEMLQQQRELWPIDFPNELTDVPRCRNASLNLGNEKHNNNDGTRSFAVWVSNKKESSNTSWYLLFPEWGVAIELKDGTWISWNGKDCGHCSATPNLAGGEQLLSLFCSIPENLCNHLEKLK
jgi:hypothetical protein